MEGGAQYDTFGIIGILNIRSHIFIVIITERETTATLPTGDVIFLIKGVEFIPFDKNIKSYTVLPKEIVDFVEGIKKTLVGQGFFFSYHADLTSSQQRQALVNFEYNPGPNYDFKFRDEFQDKRYLWNQKILQDFTFQNVDPFWTVPII
jgi:hypothetical protein